MPYELINDDMMAALDQLYEEGAVVDAVVTDPPYHLTTGKKGGSGPASVNLNSPAGRSRVTTGFMGKAWDGGDIALRPETWEKVLRILPPGGHLLAFGGTRTFHRMTCAIEDAGFEIRDTVMWVYGCGFPKSHDVSKAIDKMKGATREVVGVRQEYAARANKKKHSNNATQDGFANPQEIGQITAPATPEAEKWHGWGTALKPAWEPVILARKPLEGTVAQNVLKYGTGAINIDRCRIEAINRPHRVIDPKPEANGVVYAGRQEAGHGFDGGSKAVGVTNLGRWPANLIHDGSDEVVEKFPYSKNGVAVQRNRDGQVHNEIYGEYKKPPAEDVTYGGEGSAARFFYCAKSSKSDRNSGLEGTDLSNNHPTVKPTELMRYLIRLITPPGGIVMDPFMGSGSTGRAAMLEGFPFLGIEKDRDYFDIAHARIEAAEKKFKPARRRPKVMA